MRRRRALFVYFYDFTFTDCDSAPAPDAEQLLSNKCGIGAIMPSMKKVWREFDSHAEVEEYHIQFAMSQTPEERFFDCIRVSVAHWEMLYGPLPERPLKNTKITRVRDRNKDQ